MFLKKCLLYCLRCLGRENLRFRCEKSKNKLGTGTYPRKATAQTRIFAHEHESTAEFSVTPFFAGAAWRKAVETAV